MVNVVRSREWILSAAVVLLYSMAPVFFMCSFLHFDPLTWLYDATVDSDRKIVTTPQDARLGQRSLVSVYWRWKSARIHNSANSSPDPYLLCCGLRFVPIDSAGTESAIFKVTGQVQRSQMGSGQTDCKIGVQLRASQWEVDQNNDVVARQT